MCPPPSKPRIAAWNLNWYENSPHPHLYSAEMSDVMARKYLRAQHFPRSFMLDFERNASSASGTFPRVGITLFEV